MKIMLISLSTIVFLLAGCRSSRATSDVPIFMVASPTSKPTQVAPGLRLAYLQSRQYMATIYFMDNYCNEDERLCFNDPVSVIDIKSSRSDDHSKPIMPISVYALSPDGDHLAVCAVGVGGRDDVFVADVSTQEWINLTNSSEEECHVEWPLEGKYLYYLACAMAPNGSCHIQLIRSSPDGKEKTLLLSRLDYDFDGYSISPVDGKIVISSSDLQGYDQLYLVNEDGSHLQQITFGDMNNGEPSFSPDGQKVVFVRSNRLNFVTDIRLADVIWKDLTTGEEENLTELIDLEAYNPVISQNGKWVAFTAYDSTDMTANILVTSSDGSTLIQVTQGNEYKAGPFWLSSYDEK